MHEARIGLELNGYTNTPQLDRSAGPPSPAPLPPAAARRATATSARCGPASSTMPSSSSAITWSRLASNRSSSTSRSTPIATSTETYTFGGGVTSTGTTITGIQQYVNALSAAPNGSPTAYTSVTGNPDLAVFQFRNAIYFQDDWKALPNLHFAYGLRYYTQTNPTNATGLQPRLGVAWSPDKKQTWSLHAHVGLFSGRNSAHSWAQIVFTDGTDRITSTFYNPTCSNGGAFDPTRCAPVNSSGSAAPQTIRKVQPHMPNLFYSIYNLGFSKTLPRGFSFSADYYVGEMWHATRTENINSPTNGSPSGPRPYGANLNILQLQGSGTRLLQCRVLRALQPGPQTRAVLRRSRPGRSRRRQRQQQLLHPADHRYQRRRVRPPRRPGPVERLRQRHPQPPREDHLERQL